MAREYLAKVEDGVVVQVGVMAEGQEVPDGWVQTAQRVGIGWRQAGQGRGFQPPPPNVVEPEPPMTDAEKLEQRTGLTVAQIRAVLGL